MIVLSSLTYVINKRFEIETTNFVFNNVTHMAYGWMDHEWMDGSDELLVRDSLFLFYLFFCYWVDFEV